MAGAGTLGRESDAVQPNPADRVNATRGSPLGSAQKLDYSSMMDMQQAVNLEILTRFEKEGIQFAFPTQTMRMVQSSGHAPAGAIDLSKTSGA